MQDNSQGTVFNVEKWTPVLKGLSVRAWLNHYEASMLTNGWSFKNDTKLYNNYHFKDTLHVYIYQHL